MPNTNPTADPTDYPPAVLKEAEEAGRAAFEAAMRDSSGAPLDIRRHRASAKASEAAANVFARHTVAVRMAARESAISPESLAMLKAGIESAKNEPLVDLGSFAKYADPLTPEQDAALREQSAQAAREASAIATGIDVDDLRIYDPEPSPEIARLTAERDALAKRVEALRAVLEDIGSGFSLATRGERARLGLAADDEAAR